MSWVCETREAPMDWDGGNTCESKTRFLSSFGAVIMISPKKAFSSCSLHGDLLLL
jgi:hypothetical protein